MSRLRFLNLLLCSLGLCPSLSLLGDSISTTSELSDGDLNKIHKKNNFPQSTTPFNLLPQYPSTSDHFISIPLNLCPLSHENNTSLPLTPLNPYPIPLPQSLTPPYLLKIIPSLPFLPHKPTYEEANLHPTSLHR